MAKSAYKRNNFFISKEIQGAYIVSFLVPLTIMLVIIAVIFGLALRSSVALSIESINRDINRSFAESMLGRDEPTVRDYRNAAENVRRVLVDGNSEINRRKNADAIIASLMYILIPGFLLAILQVVLLTVFFSHKIAGPVFRIELACKRVINGDYKEKIYLRDGDKMSNLANLFNEMTEKTRERLQKALELKTEEEKENFREQNKLNP